MLAQSSTPTEIIGASALRLAGLMAALRDAHDDHNIAPGPHDDLTSPEFTAAAHIVYRETLSDSYLRQLGMTFGAVSVLMDLVVERQPQRTTQVQWLTVRGYFAAAADRLAPEHHQYLGELPSLALATKPTPPVVRFDLLAGLVSRPAVLRTFDAARWVSELADELPDLSEVELSPASIAALAASHLD